MIMKLMDMRFDVNFFRQMIGRMFEKFKCDEFQFTNTVTGIVGLYIGDKVFQLRNEVINCDYFGSNDESAVWSISEATGGQIKSDLKNGKQIDTVVKNIIRKIILLNEKQVLFENGIETYNVWVTRAVIFFAGDKEIAFIKDNVPFSEEIEIIRGHDLINYISENDFFTKEAGWDDNILAKYERVVVIVDGG